MPCVIRATSFIVILAAGLSGAAAQTILEQTPENEANFPDFGAAEGKIGANGNLTFGLYYGSLDGLAGMAGVNHDGLFGTDERLDLKLYGSRYNQSLTFSLTDDDFLERSISRTIRLSGQNVDPKPASGQQYGHNVVDLSTTFTLDKGTGVAKQLGFGLARYGLDITANMPAVVTTHVDAYGANTDVVYAFAGIDMDRAESGWVPSQGWRAGANLELGNAGGKSYAKATFGGEVFKGISDTISLRGHGGMGLSATSGDVGLPLFKTFQGGGIGSVRGFASGTMGPVSAISGSTSFAYPGGESAWSAGVEIIRDIPAVEKLKLVAFYDVGGVSGSSTPFNELRSSVGVGVIWHSPIGPMSVFLAKPLVTKATDKIETLQLAYGMSF